MRRALALIGALAVFEAACGAPGPVAHGTASPSAATSAQAVSPSPSPVPSPPAGNLGFLLPASPPDVSSAPRLGSISCSGSIGSGDPLAVVELGSGGALRDYADVAHPRTVCQLGSSPYDVSLLDAHELLVRGEGELYVVVDLPGLERHWFQLPATPGQFSELAAVSPHLDQVVYLSADQADNTDKVHVVTRAGDQVVAALYNPHGGRCGSPDDSKAGAFSAATDHVFVLDQPVPTINSLLVLKGTATQLLLAPPKASGELAYAWPAGAQPEMALWSPASDTLYYRQGGDVWRWTEATGPVRFLAGVRWYYPTISADGRYLAYATVRPDGATHNVYLVDLKAGASPRLIGQLRTLPVFVNATQLWYLSESPGICGPGGNKPLVYDVTTGAEAASILKAVYSTWPSTSSNF